VPWAAVACGAFLALSCWWGTAAVSGQSAGFDPVLRYGVSVSTIADVNPNDALAASLLFARTIGQAVGAWTDARAMLFLDSDSMVKAMNANSTDLAAMSSMEFLSVERVMKADPFVLYQTSGEVDVEYVLLARAGIRSAADLAGRRIAVYNPSNQRDLGDTWLDVLLMEAGLPEGSRSVQPVRPFKKRSQAAMALFFNQVDAAVELKSAFDTAVEMNPQLGQQLKVLARSPKLLPGLVCVRRSMDADLRRRYLEKAVTMHQMTQYRQTFIVLHVNRLVAFEPRFLDNIRALSDRYQALKRRTPTR
jgi:phosphonate transport system substrate-binding protein